MRINKPVCVGSVDETLDLILQRKYESSQEYYQEKTVIREIIEKRGLASNRNPTSKALTLWKGD